MGKLSKMGAQPAARSPVSTTGQLTSTYEGGVGHIRDARSELFLLAAANMVGEDTFYEQASKRDSRYRTLIRSVMAEDGGSEWITGLAPYLRGSLNMRSAALVLAAEYVANKGPFGRRIVASVLLRPDEPGALLGYWMGTYGRSIPAAIKRGIADALPRLYTERNTIKYDGKAQTYRFGDVIDLVHPKPGTGNQSMLYKYLIDRRHNRPDEIPMGLETLRADTNLWSLAPAERQALIDGSTPEEYTRLLAQAGMTWERYASWIGRPINSREWEALVPNMGLMAIVRNLRNMDEAGVSPAAEVLINAKLYSAEEVARSRQLPFRFFTAWREVRSMRWGQGLEKALNHSLANVPALSGRTLIMVDQSGSMEYNTISERSTVTSAELARVFGVALATRAEQVDLVAYDERVHPVMVRRNDSILRTIQAFPHMGAGTQTIAILAHLYNNHDRVVIVTDEQAFGTWRGNEQAVASIKVPIYTFNLVGYRAGQMPSGGQGESRNRHTFGGLSDSSFKLLEVLETGHNGHWPWESE